MSGRPDPEADGRSARRTFCRLCQALCGVIVEVEGNRVIRAKGDPDHPLSQGYTCSKGRSLPEYHHDPQRLKTPLVRENGELVAVPWERAMDLLVTNLEGLREQHGAESIGVFHASHGVMDAPGRALAQRFFGALGTPQWYSTVTMDAPNKTLVPDLVAGAPFLFPLVDWDDAHLVVLVGQNPVVSHGHASAISNPVVRLRSVQRRGGHVVAVDPRTTETARLADAHIKVRPGSDAALLAFLVRSTLRSGADQRYLEECADAASVEGLRSAVEPFDLHTTADICGVVLDELERVRDLVTATGRLAVVCGTGVSMSAAPNATEWLAWALGAVTGSLDRRGGILFNPGVLRPQEQALTLRKRHSGPPPTSRPELAHQYGEYPVAALADEIDAGILRALFILGGNPAVVVPDRARTSEALRQLELLVVCDVRHTETTEIADVVLPMANPLERGDITAVGEFILPRPFVQYSPPVVAPLHDSRPMWQVFAELGGRLGLFDADIIAPNEEAVISSIAKRSRLSWQEIRDAPSGLVAEDAPGPGWLIPARLPSGQLDLAPRELVAELKDWLERNTSGDEQGLELRLINRRLPHQTNTVLRDAPRQRNRKPLPTLLVHPDDGHRLGVTDGELALVHSQVGRTTAIVELDPGIRPGVVSLPHGWTTPEVNRLTSSTDQIDPLTGMVRLSGIPATISKA